MVILIYSLNEFKLYFILILIFISIKQKKLVDTQPFVLVTSAHDKAQNKLTDYIKNSSLFYIQLLINK